jgi:hypothetical protein
MYEMCLSTFICCRYAYGCTFTLLHLWMLPRLGNLGQRGYYEMMAWWHCWGYRPPLTAFYIHIWYMKVFEHLHMLWISIWVHPYTVTPGKVGPDFGNFDQCGYYEMMAQWHCWGCTPPLTDSHIHIGIWKVFEHLHMLWIGIWGHPYTVTLEKLA